MSRERATLERGLGSRIMMGEVSNVCPGWPTLEASLVLPACCKMLPDHSPAPLLLSGGPPVSTASSATTCNKSSLPRVVHHNPVGSVLAGAEFWGMTLSDTDRRQHIHWSMEHTSSQPRDKCRHQHLCQEGQTQLTWESEATGARVLTELL